MKRTAVFLLVSLVLLVFDQWSKWAVTQAMNWGDRVAVFSWLDIVLVHNRGAAFSFLSDVSWANYFFTAVAVVASIVIVYLLFSNRDSVLQRLALSLILAGALGNLADRIRQGYVVDFISVHYKDWYYPSFNVADSCISGGACLLLLGLLFGVSASRRPSR